MLSSHVDSLLVLQQEVYHAVSAATLCPSCHLNLCPSLMGTFEARLRRLKHAGTSHSLMGVDASRDARCQGSCEPLEKTMREAAGGGGEIRGTGREGGQGDTYP